MNMIRKMFVFMLFMCSVTVWAKKYEVNSPDGVLKAIIEVKNEGTFLV